MAPLRAIEENRPIVKSAYQVEAISAPLSSMAESVALEFGVNIVVAPDLASREITVSVKGIGLEPALDVIAFFSKTTWRKIGDIYYIGAQEPEQFLAIPAAGVDVSAVRMMFGNAVLVGDSILLKSTPANFAQLNEIIEKMRRRASLKFRVLIAEISASDTPALTQFLNANGSISVKGDVRHGVTVSLPIDLQMLVDWLHKRNDADVKIDTVCVSPSGEKMTVNNGYVIERPVYVRADQSDKDLITRYDRLQMGLTIELTPFQNGDKWFVKYKAADADIQSGSGVEQRLAFEGAVELAGLETVRILGIDRDKVELTTRSVPVLGKIPGIGRAFRGTSKMTDKRSVIVYVQRVD